MIDVITPDNRHLFEDMLEQMWRQRSAVFVDNMGWDLPTKNGLEIDEYDRDDTVYLLASDGDRNVTASARLLPTTGPHLMTDLFSDMCETGVPTGPKIWEISRYYVRPMTPTRRNLLLGLKCGITLVYGAAEYALLNGIEQITFVTDMDRTPEILGAGYDVTPLGLPTQYSDGKAYLASVLNVSLENLNLVRVQNKLEKSVLRYADQRVAA
jgi:acyl-homoserine lactone synthase